MELKREVRSVYYQLWYLQDRRQLYKSLDSVYDLLTKAAILKVRTGDSPGLDSIAANARWRELQAQLIQIDREIEIMQENLRRLLNTTTAYYPGNGSLAKISIDSFADIGNHPVLQLQQQQIAISKADIGLQRNMMLPDLQGRFFTQRLYGITPPYAGFSVTVGLPIAGRSYTNKIKAAELESRVQKEQLSYETQALNTSYINGLRELEKNRVLLRFYEGTGLQQADAIIKAASLAYRAGEISYAGLSQYLTQAIDIRKNYLENLNQYNQSAIQFIYIINR